MSLLPSLLDTLHGHGRETPTGMQQGIEQIKESVRRDLENLLNARRRPDELPEYCDLMQRALPKYGLPDLTNFGVWSERGRLAFKRCVESAVADFEPRLESIRVELLDGTASFDRMVRFRIHARLKVEPAPQLVTFNSYMEPISCGFKLEYLRHG